MLFLVPYMREGALRVLSAESAAAWTPEGASASPASLPAARRRLRAASAEIDVTFRASTLELGAWLGWLGVAAVLGGLGLDVAPRHRGLLLAVTLAAAACNAVASLVPWREWLELRRGRLLVDVWSGGLIGFVALLVFAGGASFALLLFLTVPFIAVAQSGRRRALWLTVNAATCAAAIAFVPLPVGPTAMRLALVAAVTAAALVLAQAIRGETAAHERASARAELESALAIEANHRIKNNLQTVADLLLLARPNDGNGEAFDRTASRIRSIATVHRLLSAPDDRIDARALLEGIAESVPVRVVLDAERVALDPAAAQKLGIVANELITNAYQHGAPPVVVRLRAGREIRLEVDDDGDGPGEAAAGLGLELVRRLAEHGLRGRFELAVRAEGGAHAELAFPAA